MLTTGPLKYFHEKFPQAEIHFWTTESGEILSHLPWISQIHITPQGASYAQILSHYRKLPSYEVIFDWQGSFKFYPLFFFKKSPYVRVNKHSWQRRAFVKKRQWSPSLKKHVVEKYAQTYGDFFQIPVPELESLRPCLPGFTAPRGSKIPHSQYVVLHPYASQKNKVWPYFFQLADLLLKDQIPVVVVGQGEQQWPSGVVDLSNQTSLNQLLGVIHQSKVLVTTDSGPMHMGLALKKPTISIFGPTTRELGFYPFFQNSLIFEHKTLNCRPCHVHGGNECPLQHFRCMKDLSVEKVFYSTKEAWAGGH